jgi:exosortase/archaeosortase
MEKKVSVLAVLGWTLFSIAFLLKVHYYLWYRKHKKLALALQDEKNDRMIDA